MSKSVWPQYYGAVMNLLLASRRVWGALLLATLLLVLLKPSVVIVLAVLLLPLLHPHVRGCAHNRARRICGFVHNHAGYILAIQCVVYAFAYDALMPTGMYFSPDSLSYLAVSNLVPPTFSLLASSLVQIEVGLGSERIVLLRYLVIAIYSAAGWLIARALIRSGRPLLATFVLPTIWSMSSLTQWFNFYLTDGIATALLVASIGAYANMCVSIQGGAGQSYSAKRWVILFVFLGMASFSMRPAFAFVAPVMALMMLNRAIFSWRRLAGVIVGIALFATVHFSFAQYWHGHASPSQLGGVLTTLVFDFPVSNACADNEETNLCRTQRALEPFIRASLSSGSSRERYLYKMSNNLEVIGAARAAVQGNEMDMSARYSVLSEIALLKIKSNPGAYILTVLGNSYYAVEMWGDHSWNNDSLGNWATVNASITSGVAAAVSDALRTVAGIRYDPTIKHLPNDKFYRAYLFNLPRLVIGHGFVKDFAFIIFMVAVIFTVRSFFFFSSLPGSILFSCSAFGVAGIVFQNAFFPVIPRLLDPFHPLAALGVLMFVSMAIDKVESSSLGVRDIGNDEARPA